MEYYANDVLDNMSAEELTALRAHIDEAKSDPDYSIVWSHNPNIFEEKIS